MKAKNKLTAGSEMLIRRPVGEVFEALVNPGITSKFWFSSGSGRLESGKKVEWEWGQFGVSATIDVTQVRQNELIQFRWPSDEEGSAHRSVEISFERKSGDTTFVRVVEKGFKTNDAELIDQIAGQTEGWALVLSALKAYLEHDIILNVITDHKPPN